MSRHENWASGFIRNAFGAFLCWSAGCAWIGPSNPSANPTPVPIPPPAQNQSAKSLPPPATGPADSVSSTKAADIVPATFLETAADAPPTPKEGELASKWVHDDKAPAASSQVLPQPKPAPETPPSAAAPATAETHKLAIDMPYALRMANASNPTIAAAAERTRQAQAQQLGARYSFLPSIWVGGNPDNYVFMPTFYSHNGLVQNASGNVLNVTKSNFAALAGASINYKLSDVIFAPYIARDSTAAAEARARAVRTNVQLDVALTYLDLMRAYGALAINSETLARAQQMYDFAKQANDNGLGKTTADANRARTEVEVRKQERLNLEGQAAVAAARLAQLLLLQPSVDLVPADVQVVPIALVSTEPTIEELIVIGLMNRPELAESRALVAAAYKRWRQDRTRPLLPTISVIFYDAQFGGSSNLYSSLPTGGREDFIAQAAWELKNLGLGDLALARASRARYNEANFRRIEVEAEVAADVTAAAKLVRLHERSLRNAQEAVRQAEEMWTRLSKAAFGMGGPARKYDPLEPLIAEQQLDQARMLYLDEVIAFNRYQFRLYWAMGQPPLDALPQATNLPVEVPVLPSKAQQEGKDLDK